MAADTLDVGYSDLAKREPRFGKAIRSDALKPTTDKLTSLAEQEGSCRSRQSEPVGPGRPGTPEDVPDSERGRHYREGYCAKG